MSREMANATTSAKMKRSMLSLGVSSGTASYECNIIQVAYAHRNSCDKRSLFKLHGGRAASPGAMMAEPGVVYGEELPLYITVFFTVC